MRIKVTVSYKPFIYSIILFSLIILFMCPVNQIKSALSQSEPYLTLANASSFITLAALFIKRSPF